MRGRLLRLYWTMVAPAAALFAVLYILGKTASLGGRQWAQAHPWMGPAIFIAAATLGIAGPLALRTAFVSAHRTATAVGGEELLRLEQRQMLVALWTPYLAVAAAFLELPDGLFVGTALACFYALYYFYPSQRRIAHERRVFRAR
jgi:hypothetical protein